MRQNRANSCGDRSNALWGRGSRGEARSNALWGRGGRRAGAAVLTTVAAFTMLAAVSVASPGDGKSGTARHSELKAYVEDSLLASIQQNPKQSFDVILQGNRGQKSSGFLAKVLADTSGSSDEHLSASSVRAQFNAINGIQATVSGRVILHL